VNFLNYLCRGCLKEDMRPIDTMTLECPACGHRVHITLFPIRPNMELRTAWMEDRLKS
jgi:DNA-directed RNA polymerase subunit RPC12/RpoP